MMRRAKDDRGKGRQKREQLAVKKSGSVMRSLGQGLRWAAHAQDQGGRALREKRQSEGGAERCKGVVPTMSHFLPPRQMDWGSVVSVKGGGAFFSRYY